MLDFPHPLFAHDVDLCRIRRWTRHSEKDFSSPEEKAEKDKERRHRPRDLKRSLPPFSWRSISVRSASITNAKENDREENEQRHEATQREQSDEDVVDVGCEIRGRRRDDQIEEGAHLNCRSDDRVAG